MTVSNNDAITPFLGDGTTKTFAYDFPVSATDELQVFVDGLLVDPANYTASLSPQQVVFTTAPVSGAQGGIIRATTLTQEITYSRTSNSMNVAALADQLDAIVTKLQEVERDAGFAIKRDYYNSTPMRLVGSVTTGGLFYVDANGNLTTSFNISDIEQFKTDAETAATTATTKAAAASASQTAAAASETAAAASASAASASETNALASKNAAAASETNAATSEANAAASETAAALSETNAAASEANAATSESNAADSASAAATSATAATNAQVTSQSLRDQMLDLFNQFNDRYLGEKTSDPTLDNDGNALVGGALYFDSVNGIMKVYTGTIWVAAYVSGANFAALANNGSDYDAPTFRTNLSLYSKAESDARYAQLSNNGSDFVAATFRTNLSLYSKTESDVRYAQVASLATVATSGSASDLGTGTLPDARLPNRLAIYQAGLEISDWNAALATGWYRSSTAANAPDTGWFIGRVEMSSAAYGSQTLWAFDTMSSADMKMWRREIIGGVPQAWYRLRLSQTEQQTLWDARYTQGSLLASTAAGKGASLVGIQDSAGKIAATTVEGALAELAALLTGYESAAQTITAGGSLTLAHGLGAQPKRYQAYLKCVTADLGYSAGDETLMNPHTSNNTATSNRGLAMVPDATNINVRFGSDASVLSIIRKDTGGAGNPTLANWRLIVRAWL